MQSFNVTIQVTGPRLATLLELINNEAGINLVSVTVSHNDVEYTKVKRHRVHAINGVTGLDIVKDFITKRGVGREFLSEEIEIAFTNHGLNAHSSTSRLSELKTKGFIASKGSGKFVVLKVE